MNTESGTQSGASYLEASDATFNQQVLDATQPVLVDFWAPWCGPCRMLGPALEELAREYSGRARVVKVNVDENPSTAARYAINNIPSLLVFKEGEVVERMVGLTSKKAMAAKLDAHVV